MTYHELLLLLQKLTPEQLSRSVAVELLSSEETFSSSTGDVQLSFAEKDNDVLDPGHPIIRAKD